MEKITSKNLFYFCYIIFIFSSMFANVKFLSIFMNKINYIIYLGLLLCILLKIKTYRKKELIFMVFSLIVITISWIISKNNSIFILFLFIFAMKNIEFDSLIKFDLKMKILFVPIVIGLHYLGLTNDLIMYREDGTVRSSMGFGHPNTFAVYLFAIFCEYIYLNRDKKRFLGISILAIVVFNMINYFSDSRGSAYTIIMLYLFITVKKIDFIGLINKKFVKYFLTSIIFIFTAFSYFISINYNPYNKMMYEINKIFTGRISSSYKFLNNYNINLLGNELYIVSTKQSLLTGENTIILDNAYIKLILQLGIITYLIFAIYYTLSIRKAYSKNNYILVILFFIFAIRGLFGNVLFYLYGNVFLLYFSEVIFKTENNLELVIDAKNKKCC